MGVEDGIGIALEQVTAYRLVSTWLAWEWLEQLPFLPGMGWDPSFPPGILPGREWVGSGELLLQE